MAPKKSRFWWTLFAFTGCAARPQNADVAIAAATTTAFEGTSVGVTVSDVPTSPLIDGNLGEWGELPRPPASKSPPAAQGIIWSAPDSIASNPTDAPATTTFALDRRGAYVAAKLKASGQGGIWLGVGFEPSALPMPGKYIGNAGYVPLGTPKFEGCADTIKPTEDGEGTFVEVNSPSAVDACKAEVARHIERTVTHDKRFRKLYRLEASGVRVVSENGEIALVPDAQIAFGTHDGETTMEAFLPADALPRVAEAPIKTVKLVARAAVARRPRLDAWVWLSLPTAVPIEPHGSLLAHAFRRAGDHGVAGADGLGSTSYRLPRALSYRFSDPSRVEVVDSTDCVSLAARELPIYERTATSGDVEIGYVASPRGNSCAAENEPWLAVFANGKLVSMAETGALRGTVVRGRELHVLSYSEVSWTPVWSVIALAPDGSQREAVEPAAGLVDLVGKSAYWDKRVEIRGRDADGFGFQGTVGKRRIEVVWRWDEGKRMYRAKPRVLLSQAQRAR